VPEQDASDIDGEVVDGLPVVAEPGGVAQERPAPAGLVPARQAAALAASGFVAGVTTVAVVRGARARRAARKKRRGSALGEIVSSNSFLIDVHLLRRD
jgi:hypothetical protein